MGLAADDGVIATAAAKGATATTYGMASISAALGWLASMDWVAVSGVCIGVVTAIVNAYYKHQRSRREAEGARLDAELKRRDDKRKELESQARIALMQHQMTQVDE